MFGTSDSDEGTAGSQPRSVGGIFNSLMSMFTTVVATAQTRLDLLVTELQEEVHRAAGMLVWVLVAVAFLSLCFFMAGLSVIIAFWDTHRLLAAVLVTATFLLFGLIALLKVHGLLRGKTRMLDATRTELERDVEQLRSQSRQ